MRVQQKVLFPLMNALITLTMWFFFGFNFPIIFIPLCIASWLRHGNKEKAFQYANHKYFKIFFSILKYVTPGMTLDISEKVRSLNSTIVVSNHISYLDPILLVSLFPRQKTIVKNRFFHIPLMSFVLKNAGYIPSSSQNNDQWASDKLLSLSEYIQNGGLLFVFPEGRRSRSGCLSSFQKGVFTLAARIKAPISVIYIHNTDRLFHPDRLMFQAMIKNRISIELVAIVQPEEYQMKTRTELRDFVYDLLKTHLCKMETS